MQDFRLKWESFVNGFDSLEEIGAWDTESNGEMETYCENVLICILVKAVCADKNVNQAEIDAINNMFGFELDVETVSQIFEIMEDETNDILDEPTETFDMIKRASERIYQSFVELVTNACQIIIDSDGVSSDVEIEKLNAFVEKIK